MNDDELFDEDSDVCAEAFGALKRGDWGAWQGLPAACTRADAEAYLGPSAEGPDGSGRLGGTWALFRNYPASTLYPLGVQVWFDEFDKVILVQIATPQLEDAREQLGEPFIGRSQLAPYHEQWVYAERGLALHVNRANGIITRLYGFVPTTTEAFMESWLSQVATTRRRLRS